MQIPTVQDPERMTGLYLFDFGDWTAVGYTAEEVGLLLESEQYRDGKVYRIERAAPDGSMELRGVSTERFQLESGMLFYCDSEADARRDYAELDRRADEQRPPTRAFLHLADRGSDVTSGRFVVALVYPAEFDADVSRWLVELDYAGGAWVEGGTSVVTDYYAQQNDILERKQLWSRQSESSRSREEVFASVKRAAQR